MSEIIDHKSTGLNEHIRIDVLDSPGPGGACHEYLIQPLIPEENPPAGAINAVTLKFQKGGVQTAGVNGLSNEALLAVLLHRYRGLRDGPFPCRENVVTVILLEEVLSIQKRRTMERSARGVEGKLVP